MPAMSAPDFEQRLGRVETDLGDLRQRVENDLGNLARQSDRIIDAIEGPPTQRLDGSFDRAKHDGLRVQVAQLSQAMEDLAVAQTTTGVRVKVPGWLTGGVIVALITAAANIIIAALSLLRAT